jgi:predicted nucleotidyltransferase
MNANQLLQSKRQEIIQIAARHGAYNLRVFGSVARGEARPDSDVDFLVNLEANRSLLDLARLLRELQTLLNRRWTWSQKQACARACDRRC